MLIPMLMMATVIASALMILAMVESAVRPDGDVRMPELRVDPHLVVGSVEHRREVAYGRRRQLRRRMRRRPSVVR